MDAPVRAEVQWKESDILALCASVKPQYERLKSL
jgi:hypothetical protein